MPKYDCFLSRFNLQCSKQFIVNLPFCALVENYTDIFNKRVFPPSPENNVIIVKFYTSFVSSIVLIQRLLCVSIIQILNTLR